ncbi:MAG: tRNA (guanosine(37)-N1)-methyltransferase TrmD [Candidatus Latescibacteria bacterium]|nr:tRNA (guanosine(37)-N1)-methyltransferase TrmD [Candidatus Latescibacterota bacterium]NIM66494.1 tRNA (guanosine(37)-N1)-methyltransferase TrmD [Candidatus Latescibacterota bacterium]NIO02974.1 tRNA (guanosine(37)-N1)-methyltransferase TrmD [Candidatus Latescibacterota bacterium]NIO30109.1 tRNA (guanosine(37)-N1)-methyltransferase TrmD [Candidatus Latescibacterota bacterium]NIO57728.1 tRNA (guanosine(37)-N1)-methyltransferase TrmD [Candidatus Latescibacterota bacterium]
MKANVITIFPDVMEEILSMGMLGVAQKKGLLQYKLVNPRDFTKDAHRTVDDVPYGGGAGMVMMAPPIIEAVESLSLPPGSPVILMSPAGKRFDQDLAKRLAGHPEITFICGRYKGVDERVRELVVTEEVSIGDFILSGGELAAAVCIEAMVRLLENVLGNEDSRDTDSFATKRGHLLDCAYYTRPAEYRGSKVPDVLLSGNHKEIEKWRERSSLEKTRALRPDLLKEETNKKK